MERIRAFVAIELDHAVRAALQGAVEGIESAPAFRAARWVSPDRMHLTLQFLGQIDADQVPGVKDAMDRACASSSPFSIALTEPGFFPGASKPHVAWIGVGGDVDALERLQRSLETELSGIGFTAESRAYHPHLTLARVKDSARRAARSELVELVRALRVEAQMVVREIGLFRSDAEQGGSIYTCLARSVLR